MATIKTQYVLVGKDQTRRAFSSFNRSVRATTRATSALAATFGTFVGIQTVRSIANAGLALQRIERTLKAATGSAEAAAEEFAFIRSEADRLGLNLEASATGFAKLTAAARGTALEGQAARDIFVGISEASTVLGLSADQTQGALTAIEQIISKGKVSAEELRGQLGERLPGAFQIAARSIGKTTAELDQLLVKGDLTAEELLPLLAKELRKTFGPEVAEAANSAQAAFNRFNTAVFELQAAFAESGLLGSLSDAADALREIFDIIGDRFNPGPLDSLNQQIATLRDQLFFLREQGADDSDINVQNIQREIVLLEQLYVNLLANQKAEQANRKETIRLAKEEKEAREAALEASLIPEITVRRPRTADPLLAPLIENVEKTTRAAQDLGFVFESAFEDAIVNGNKLRDVMQGLLQDIIRVTARIAVTEPLGQFFGGVFGGIFGGGRAVGGPVRPGVAYTVGEKGPETFVPSVPGQIVPTGGMGGGVVINQTVNATGADSEVRRALPGLLEQSRQATIASVIELQKQGRI